MKTLKSSDGIMKKTAKNKGKRPSMFWLATEPGRALSELGALMLFERFQKYNNFGDGHPVLVLPGFMATDKSTKKLRRVVQQAGYEVHPWELGRNVAKVKFLEHLLGKVDVIHTEYRQKISIVGWSLGGVYARQLAKARPDIIRQVITLGSPFQGIDQPNNVAWVYNLINGGKKRASDIGDDLLADIPHPPPVPSTAIYTKEDGVVPWKLCMEKEETAIHQNIQVRGSHLGLGVNPAVLEIILDRLQYTQEDWVHFRASNILKDLFLYPSL